MSNLNIYQVYEANPITSNTGSDLMYFGQSPYGSGNDAAMTYTNFAAQFGAPYTASALTKTNDTNVTLTLGGTPTTALLQATSLTLGWTGSLAVGRGGTGNTTFTAYSVICAGTTSTGAFQNVSGVGTSGQVLTSNGAGALPSWQAAGGSSPWTGGSGTDSAYGGGSTDGGANYALAWGKGGIANNNGSFVITDSSGTTQSDSVANEFVATFEGGFKLFNQHNLLFSTDSNYNVFIGPPGVGSTGSNSFLAVNNTTSYGAYQIVMGNGASAHGDDAVAIGYYALASHTGSFVICDNYANGITDATSQQFVSSFVNGHYFYIGTTSALTIDTNSNVCVENAGSGLRVKEGSNAKQGVATLSGGTVIVSNTSTTSNSRIFLTAQDNNSSGSLRVSARTAGTSFTITSSNSGDSGVVAYELFEPS